MSVSFAIDSWSPDYGSSLMADDDLLPAPGAVDVTVERDVAGWQPIPADGVDPIDDVRFVDGVRRMDARVWITDERGTRQGLAVSYAAGTVRCNGQATIEQALVERGLFAPAGTPDLVTSLSTYTAVAAAGDDTKTLLDRVQLRMTDLEIAVAGQGNPAALTVIDGPLRGRQHVRGAIGYVKTHHTAYLPETISGTVAALGPGERTPLFLPQSGWARFSWYLRLPYGTGHPWAGVVRCEASADLALPEVIMLADRTAATLPRFASQPHKDPRAPQNLYPIAGLERELKRRLGDPATLERALRAAV